MSEEELGVITRYFGKIGVAAIKITQGELKVGDRIRIEGHGGDWEETIASIQIDRQNVSEAVAGQEVGIKLTNLAHEKDLVYKITG